MGKQQVAFQQPHASQFRGFPMCTAQTADCSAARAQAIRSRMKFCGWTISCVFSHTEDFENAVHEPPLNLLFQSFHRPVHLHLRIVLNVKWERR